MNKKLHNLSPNSFEAFTQYLNGEFRNFAIKTAGGTWRDENGIDLSEKDKASMCQEPTSYAISQVTRLKATAFIKYDKYHTERMSIEDGYTVELLSRGQFVKTLKNSNFEIDYQEVAFKVINPYTITDFVSIPELKIMALGCNAKPESGSMFFKHDGEDLEITSIYLKTDSNGNEAIYVSIESEDKLLEIILIVDSDKDVYFVTEMSGYEPIIINQNISTIADKIINGHKPYMLICNKLVEIEVNTAIDDNKKSFIKTITPLDKDLLPWTKLFIERFSLHKSIIFKKESR